MAITYNNRYLADNNGERYLPITSIENILNLNEYEIKKAKQHDSDWIKFEKTNDVKEVKSGLNYEYKKMYHFKSEFYVIRFTLQKNTDNKAFKIGKLGNVYSDNKNRHFTAINTTKNTIVIVKINSNGDITSDDENIKKSDIIELQAQWYA